jgi:hypothetical protein
VENAVAEAVAVTEAVGDRLLAFEIGNEPDLFAGIHRPGDYSYADYHDEFRRYKDAIRATLPDAAFAGPDVFVRTDWVDEFAKSDAADLRLLTHHYYAQGPPDDPASTIESLLSPNATLAELLRRLQFTSASSGLPYRICETNSCFGGGKPGVSDTMAAALWCLDFLFQIAQSDAAGVNIQTGVNQLGFLSWYSPIAVNSAGAYKAQPIFYALLAFSLSGPGELVRVITDRGSFNLTAYAVRLEDGSLWLTIANKEASRDASVRATCPGVTSVNAVRLTAPSLTSTEGVQLGGSEVSSSGEWSPAAGEQVAVASGEFEIFIPAASAAIVELR